LDLPINGNNYGRTDSAVAWKGDTILRLGEMYREEIERFEFKQPIENATSIIENNIRMS
jgi:hypothetical protein